MLGLRLEKGLEDRLDKFANETRRTRSDIARDAVREYLDRHSLDAEFERQLRLLASVQDEEELERLDRDFDDLMRDEPDYNWGDKASNAAASLLRAGREHSPAKRDLP